MADRVIYSPHASIYRNQDFYVFAPVFLTTIMFPENAWFPIDMTDEEFGNSVMAALGASGAMQKPFNDAELEEARRISHEFWETNQGAYQTWVLKTQKKFGYKTKKKCFNAW